MSTLPPHAVAGIDQELAGLDTDLDHMVSAYRGKAAERGEGLGVAAAVRRLARMETL